ncbi:MAG: ROK family protein, partial [Naasia sp.]
VGLAERMGLSRASLSRLSRELVDLGFVIEGDSHLRTSRGRPAEMLHLRPEAAAFVGIKLTGDALYGVLLDLEANLVDEREYSLASTDPHAVVALIASTTAELLGSRGLPAAIGVGLAGDVLRTGDDEVVERSNFLGWTGAVPLRSMIEQATGLRASITNDVHALAGAHHWFGGGDADAQSLVVYGLGAGIGSGVVIDGLLMEGAHGRSGRIGHTRIGGAGISCDNGHRDCVHSFVTMSAIARNAGLAPDDYAGAVAGAAGDDPRCVAAFRQAAYALGAVVSESVNAFDPEVVSIMGEGVHMVGIAPDELRRGLAEHLEQLSPDDVRIELPPFHFGLYARGAAVNAMRNILS